MLKNILFFIVIVGCTQIPRNMGQLSTSSEFEGCWLIFNQDTITDSKCSGELTIDSQFLIGSLTKMFTAAQILKFEEQSKLATRDNITDHLEELKKSPSSKVWDKLRIYHLVKHRSGAPDFYSSQVWKEKAFKKEIYLEDFLNFIKKEAIDEQTVGLYRYNNTGYMMLGEIIRRVTNKEYADNLRWSFFVPLEMNNTIVGIDKKKLVMNNASTYSPELHISDLFTDGNISSTARDLSKWGQAILNKKGIFKENYSYIKMLKPSDDGYAYGLLSYRERNKEIVSHSGAWVGYRSSFFLNLTDKIGAIFLTHKMEKEAFKKYVDKATKIIFSRKKYE